MEQSLATYNEVSCLPLLRLFHNITFVLVQNKYMHYHSTKQTETTNNLVKWTTALEQLTIYLQLVLSFLWQICAARFEPT